MRRHHDEAVVMRTYDYGEGHRIVELLTRERGLIRAFAPGARRSKKRFGGTLEPTTRIRAVLRERGGRDLETLEEASVVDAHLGLRSDLESIALASYVVDLCRSLVQDTGPHPRVFELVARSLEVLDTGNFPAWGRVAVELAVLADYGAVPRVDQCVDCGRKPTAPKVRFSPSNGGLLCGACAPHWGAGDLSVRRGTLTALAALVAAGADVEVLDRAAHLPDDPEAVAEAESVLARVLEHLLGRRLKTLVFLEQIA